jgi:uncharacterized protein
MDRSKVTAVVLALVICGVLFAVGAALILSSGSPQQPAAWAPYISPYVDDRANALDASDYYDLEDFCYAVELNNSCEIAVLTVNTTHPYGINDYAVKTFEKNGIGQAGKDNGVLFVYSSDERAWRVVTGAGISDILSGAKLTELADIYLIPELDAGNYSNGITLYVYAMGLELVDNYHSAGNSDYSDYPISFIPLSWWQWGIVLGIFVAATVATRGRLVFWIAYIIMWLIGRGGSGGGRWGGGRTGGGGARGRL